MLLAVWHFAELELFDTAVRQLELSLLIFTFFRSVFSCMGYTEKKARKHLSLSLLQRTHDGIGTSYEGMINFFLQVF